MKSLTIVDSTFAKNQIEKLLGSCLRKRLNKKKSHFETKSTDFTVLISGHLSNDEKLFIKAGKARDPYR